MDLLLVAAVFALFACLAIGVRTILMGLRARKTERDFYWIFYLVNGSLCMAIAIGSGVGLFQSFG